MAFLFNGWSPAEPLQSEGGRNLVHVLAGRGYTETLTMVLPLSSEEALRATDEDRSTPLHLAVRGGRLEAVQTLLTTEGAQRSTDYQDKEFSTALHLAVEAGSEEMVQALLAVPCINLGVLNKDHMKAVELARKKGLHSIVSKLEEGTALYCQQIRRKRTYQESPQPTGIQLCTGPEEIKLL
jgi:ankyrin repeat protein